MLNSTSLPKQADFLIIGGGIIGITLSLELKTRHPDCCIVLLEKESYPGQHASGRNSGVLHAGFYYTADSLKAKLTRNGNRELTEYCLERKIAVNQCGKLVVAKNEHELDVLHELIHRGRTNHVDVELITAAEARDIEPRVKTVKQALFSPSTSTVNPNDVIQTLSTDAQHAGIQLLIDTEYQSHINGKIRTSRGDISCGYIINAGGLYADQIAHQFGFAQRYTILPFKGMYLYSTDPQESFRCNIYPVPAKDNPFLGVHLTVSVEGHVKIGPTAMPAFWRENYKGMDNFKLNELFQIMLTETKLFLSNKYDFRSLAVEELKKFSKRKLVACATELVNGIGENSFSTWDKAGIRAQLVNTRTGQLQMDFCFEGDDRSFHVLNAVSPAFTCALPFSRMMVDEIERKIN